MASKPDPEVQVHPQEKTSQAVHAVDQPPLENTAKSRWERSWPTIACGAGLFSDGYLNGVCIYFFHR